MKFPEIIEIRKKKRCQFTGCFEYVSPSNLLNCFQPQAIQEISAVGDIGVQ